VLINDDILGNRRDSVCWKLTICRALASFTSAYVWSKPYVLLGDIPSISEQFKMRSILNETWKREETIMFLSNIKRRLSNTFHKYF